MFSECHYSKTVLPDWLCDMSQSRAAKKINETQESFHTEYQLTPLIEGKGDKQRTEKLLQTTKAVRTSRIGKTEFSFGLDFQAFYTKQTKKTVSAVFMNMSLFWLSQDSGSNLLPSRYTTTDTRLVPQKTTDVEITGLQACTHLSLGLVIGLSCLISSDLSFFFKMEHQSQNVGFIAQQIDVVNFYALGTVLGTMNGLGTQDALPSLHLHLMLNYRYRRRE